MSTLLSKLNGTTTNDTTNTTIPTDDIIEFVDSPGTTTPSNGAVTTMPNIVDTRLYMIRLPNLDQPPGERYVSATCRKFESWVANHPNTEALITHSTLEVTAKNIINHVVHERRLRATYRIEEILLKCVGLYQLRRFVLSKKFRKFEEEKAATLKHKEECRWCKFYEEL
ncbi:hypothetical protein HK104_009036 [Borealophlyctis nickersoniae]|nr:hypothetical protein HK104_009036 [Borealophlyctis nickersoniae]